MVIILTAALINIAIKLPLCAESGLLPHVMKPAEHWPHIINEAMLTEAQEAAL